MKYIFCFFFIVTLRVGAQELPPIQNFYPKEYSGENQNWCISQSSDKLIYVANSGGLLEFNGANWHLYPSPNETIMRSVKVVGDKVFTGCFMEFGYWEKNELGILEYTSISKEMDMDLIEDEEFWTIIALHDYIVFQSLKRIYIYNVIDESINIIDSKATLTKMFKVGEHIYFQKMGLGVFKIESGKDFLVFDDDIVKNDEVINVFKRKNKLLVLTKHNGFYVSEDGGLVRSNNFPNGFLSTLAIYGGIRLKDKGFLLGSIANGLVRLSETGELLSRINQENGLSNNTVLALFEDIENNIWLGLDHGISYINSDAPYRVFNDKRGALGSVYASAIYNGYLYLGTNQGLFYKILSSGAEQGFKLVDNTQGQVWFLGKIGDALFCGHHSGTFLVNGGKVDKIAGIQGTWGIAKLPSIPNLLLQGNYDGLYILEKSKNVWHLKNKIKGFDNSSRYFETIGNRIFVNHEYKGVFELDVDSSFTKVNTVVIDTLLKGSNSGIAKYKGDLLYAYKKGVFKYDTIGGRFKRDPFLSTVYSEKEYGSGKLIVDEKEDRLWIFNKSNISIVAPVGLTNTLKIKNISLKKEIRDGILGYENVVKLGGENQYLIGNSSGYFKVDPTENETNEFQVYLAGIFNSSKKANERSVNKHIEGEFDNNESDFRFSFYVPQYNKYLVTEYQYRLNGIYDDWGDWSENSNVIYENLPHGEYTFFVRAKIGDTVSKNMASYKFKIIKPWYISNTMIVFYVLGILLFSLFMHNVYKRYYKKQRQKLIEKNKSDLELAQVQSEKEIIKIKNDKLKLENNVKSKELAASTMSIIRKNELLTTIKDELNKIGDTNTIKPVVKIIDKNLKDNNDWELFQEAFNNADSGFLKKVKIKHPSLSPNDLKLCAYLRLNLSSKEIAQLLRISPRSVEIKRYRLRKKLNLEHKDNLVNYILDL